MSMKILSLGLGFFFSTIIFAQENLAETQVFNEHTSFEKLVQDNAILEGRRVASLNATLRVIALRRELALTEKSAEQTPQDIVLNGGANEGLSEGMTLKVMRKVPVVDAFKDNARRELEIPFAQIKVIHVQDNLAVARLERVDSVTLGAAVGIRGVLIGDYVSSKP